MNAHFAFENSISGRQDNPSPPLHQSCALANSEFRIPSSPLHPSVSP